MVERWREKAGERRTLAFAATVDHARALAAAFRQAGVAAETVTGETPRRARAAIIDRLAGGATQVVTNCFALAEGFDAPLVGCVAIVRACGHKSTLIQIAGRALRGVDADRHPGVIKTDAIILDFACSLARHGDLFAGTQLQDRPKSGEAPLKTCRVCRTEVPLGCRSCPICGHEFESEREPPALVGRDARLIEVEVLRRSPFQWVRIADGIYVANGITGEAVIVRRGEHYVSVGLKERAATPLRIGERHQALAAADDFLCRTADRGAAHKSRAWLRAEPTEKQLHHLAGAGTDTAGMTRYGAAVRLTWQFNRTRIDAAIERALAPPP